MLVGIPISINKEIIVTMDFKKYLLLDPISSLTKIPLMFTKKF